MQYLDDDRLRQATVFHEPFPFLMAEGLVPQAALPDLRTDFPAIDRPGLFPLSGLSYGPAFAALVDELLGPEVEAALEQALGLPLRGRARLVTVRSRCRARDGAIHNDSRDKLASALLYLNAGWHSTGGRLRLLRGPSDIDDVIAEVPPVAGSFVAFRRTDNSWHGHQPYVGPRRYIMINWMVDAATAGRELARHRFSAQAKRLLPW